MGERRPTADRPTRERDLHVPGREPLVRREFLVAEGGPGGLEAEISHRGGPSASPRAPRGVTQTRSTSSLGVASTRWTMAATIRTAMGSRTGRIAHPERRGRGGSDGGAMVTPTRWEGERTRSSRHRERTSRRRGAVWRFVRVGPCDAARVPSCRMGRGVTGCDRSACTRTRRPVTSKTRVPPKPLRPGPVSGRRRCRQRNEITCQSAASTR